MKLRKNDFILIAGILLAALLSLAVYQLLYRQTGESVTITVDGEVYQTLPLDMDTTLTIPSEDHGTNTLVIHNGKAGISEASCPDHLCVHQKEISHQGESLVCLPNKVIVTVTSNNKKKQDNKKEPHLDGVAQ